MPASTSHKSSRSTLWYPTSVRPSGPKLPSRRLGASALVNGLNAVDYWAHGNDPTYLIGCMRVQVTNLWELALHSDLPQAPGNDQKTAVVTLFKECRDALYGFNPLTPQSAVGVNTSSPAYSMPTQAFAQHTPFVPTSSSCTRQIRIASTQSQIESNAKAALGAMAYLQDTNLFGSQGQALYAYIQYRLQQAIALMEGSVTLSDVVSERQRLMIQQQQAQGTQAAQYQAGSPVVSPSSTASGMNQNATPSPVAGLKAKSPSWDGMPNTNEDGQATVGSRLDWFSTYGTTLEQFAARCSRWLQANGGDQAALVSHLRQNTVPENVIRQTMPRLQ